MFNTALSHESLKSLRSLLEVHESVLNSRYLSLIQSLHNEDAKEVLLETSLNAADQFTRLEDIVRQWRAVAPPQPGEPPARRRLTLREVVESWVEIKEGSVEIYQRAAACAPTAALREALLELAREDERQVERLRALL